MPNQAEILASLSAAKIIANSKSWAEQGMTDEMRNKLRTMPWSEAKALDRTQGYNKNFPGPNRVGRTNYYTQGLKSLAGFNTPGSNVGGGTALTQKIFQNPVIKAITNNPYASKLATGVSRLGNVGLAYGLGSLGYKGLDSLGVYDKMDSAMDSAEGIFKNNYVKPFSNAANSLMNMLNPAVTGIKNFIGIPGTPETKQQQEWMKNKLLEQVRNSGSLSNEIDYTDYGSTTASGPSGDWTGGITSPQFSYGNTLGASKYTIPQQGGKVDWDKSGTAYNFDKGTIPNWIANIVNQGGIMNKDYGNNFPNYKPEPQHYTPDITITAKDILNIFVDGQMVHKGEPTITSPPQPPAPVMPTYNPPQVPAGYTRPTRSYAQQAATVSRKAKSMGVANPIKYNSGTKYGFGL